MLHESSNGSQASCQLARLPLLMCGLLVEVECGISNESANNAPKMGLIDLRRLGPKLWPLSVEDLVLQALVLKLEVEGMLDEIWRLAERDSDDLVSREESQDAARK